jgi:uncharacterized protein (DUF4415 family)
MSTASHEKIVFDNENPEWTDATFDRAKGPEQLPPEIRGAFRNTRTRGAQKTPTKTAVSLRLSPSVVEHFRATGPGWQRRIDEALMAAIERKIA